MARAPILQRLRQSAPFYVPWFPYLRTRKMQKIEKYAFLAISDLSFKISRRNRPPGPISDLHLGTGAKLLFFIVQNVLSFH